LNKFLSLVFFSLHILATNRVINLPNIRSGSELYCRNAAYRKSDGAEQSVEREGAERERCWQRGLHN